MTPFPPVLAIGLMSGTSADGIDAALVRTDGEDAIEPLGGNTFAYHAGFRKQLISLARPDALSLVDVMRAERELTLLHVSAVQQLLTSYEEQLANVQVLGFHGHTIRHLPAEGFTWQLGDGQLLANSLQRPVVYDFRKADLAAGGQAAPLAPLYHRALVRQRTGAQLVLNLGGVANITWVGSRGEITAGDTGPGCGLLDAWIQRHTGAAFDRDGAVAMSGSIDQGIVAQALDCVAYFQKPLPKSADRFQFDEVEALVENAKLSVADGAATLCAITVAAVVQAARQLAAPPKECWVTGGGRHHPLMMRLLEQRLPQVRPIAALGHAEDLLEAECFAWLAVRRIRGLPTSLPETTGASRPTCGGRLVQPAV